MWMRRPARGWRRAPLAEPSSGHWRVRDNRSADFERRSACYAFLDGQLREHTRFFAAAALVNDVLARFFRVSSPRKTLHSFRFLTEAGAALERSNLIFAAQIHRSLRLSGVDRVLVCAEQRQLQRCLRAHHLENPREWAAARGELNRLLNDWYLSSFVCQWCVASNNVGRALRIVRGRIGTDLDFAAESHRVHIGLALIDIVRQGERRRRGFLPTLPRLGS